MLRAGGEDAVGIVVLEAVGGDNVAHEGDLVFDFLVREGYEGDVFVECVESAEYGEAVEEVGFGVVAGGKDGGYGALRNGDCESGKELVHLAVEGCPLPGEVGGCGVSVEGFELVGDLGGNGLEVGC